MTGNKLYVGNMSFKTTQSELEAAFSEYGTVQSVSIVTDRDTGRPRGFGFVEMATDAEAQAAIDGLNGADLGGRALTVNVAKPREPRSGGFGGGGGGRGGDRGGYGGGGGGRGGDRGGYGGGRGGDRGGYGGGRGGDRW